MYRLTYYHQMLSRRSGDRSVRDQYDEDRYADRLRSLKQITVWLVLFYFSYTLVDIHLLDDITWRSILMRSLIVGPAAAALWFYYTRPASIRRKELAATLVSCLGCVVWCGVLIGSNDHNVLNYFYAGLVFILVLTIVITPPFEYSLYASLFVFACLYATIWFLQGVTSAYVLNHVSLGVPVLVLSLMANYRFCAESLRLYLENLRVEQLRGELALRNAELERLSSLDPLTGLANRRALAYHEEKLAKRQGSPLKAAVILVDIDHFKEYNDHYGHGEGDSCLRAVANAIKGACAPSDVVCRYGGEEFLVLQYDEEAPNGDDVMAQKALIKAETIRQRIAELDIAHRTTQAGRVTASLGVCCATLDQRTTLKTLTRCADEALYHAKQQGRNRACQRRYAQAPVTLPNDACS
ncbi:GGDEF domain-containing protein [Halomonas sp. HNIBRBA4712]|uniref:GGDEF domain-containing protein n=1 Tax=Halomonas sp. HNIBRBA4712 TaxID=3373087 RepID=UPI003747700A